MRLSLNLAIAIAAPSRYEDVLHPAVKSKLEELKLARYKELAANEGLEGAEENKNCDFENMTTVDCCGVNNGTYGTQWFTQNRKLSCRIAAANFS